MDETVCATLSFIKEIPGVKPYRIVGSLPPEREHERNNVQSIDTDNVVIHNARSQQDSFKLEDHGFEFLNFKPTVQLVGNNEETAHSFLDETAVLLQHHFKTPHVFPYDIRIRCTKGGYKEETEGRRMTVIPPAPVIHMDLTRKGAMARVHRHLHQHERDSLLVDEYRIVIVNTWMPLENPAIDCPLVIGDRRSVQQEDIIAADQILVPDFLGEFAFVRYNKKEVWYWLDKQLPGEVTLFCSFDSDRPGDTGACPHGAFNSPLASANSPHRKSVETRSIVILPKQAA